uniref:Follitropin subunit beta n=1 Tax=Sus scrofa TaxID=9823 RepID=A0A8D1LN90_PIG
MTFKILWVSNCLLPRCRMKSVQFCFFFCSEGEKCAFCMRINTIWCVDYCYTLDLVYKDPARPNIQKTCTFKQLVYETVKAPGCAHHADSLYTYPVATECHRDKCDNDSTMRGLGPSYCSFRNERIKSSGRFRLPTFVLKDQDVQEVCVYMCPGCKPLWETPLIPALL